MEKTISAMKARQNLGQIMNEVALRGDDYVIERAGKPLVAVVSMNKYEVLKRNRDDLRQTVSQFHEVMKDQDPDEMENLIAEAVTKTRKTINKTKKSK